jgi:chromosome segregation ATPase
MADRVLDRRLRALLDAPLYGEGAPTLEHLEVTLTDGYACALALEAERTRLTRRIGELAADAGANAEAKSHELSRLSQRLAKAEGELARLRGTLRDLRHRATALRSAAAPA